MSDARARVLARVREALAGRRSYAHPGTLPLAAGPPAPAGDDAEGCVAAFAERFREAGGEVVLLPDAAAAAEWLAEFRRPFQHAAVAGAVPDPLRPDLPAAPPETAELGVSLALAGASQTGSLVLGSGEGRRLQLLPPVHLVWLRAEDVRSTLGEALEAVGSDLPAVVALHSGPSKSADIGGIVVTGVHGPGRVVAAVLSGNPLRHGPEVR